VEKFCTPNFEFETFCVEEMSRKFKKQLFLKLDFNSLRNYEVQVDLRLKEKLNCYSSKKGLKHNSPNGEVVLASKFNLAKQLFLKKFENLI